MPSSPPGSALTVLVALGLALQGCASPGSPAAQTIRVETPGCPTATCELRNDVGTWQLASTPGSVTVRTSAAALQVSCRAAGDRLSGTDVASSSRPLTAQGSVAGGVAGGAAAGATFGATGLAFIPVLGAIVLVGSVAAGALAGQAVESRTRTLNYPEPIRVPMNCAVGDALTTPGVAPIGLEVRGLNSSQALAAGLGERGAVLVSEVVATGRAGAAGLRPGDIILAAGGLDLHDAAALAERLAAWPAGQPLPLRVWRAGRTLELQLAAAPAAP